MRLINERPRHELRSMRSWLCVVVVSLVIGMSSPVLFAAEEHTQDEETGEQHEATGESHESTEAHSEEHAEEHDFHKNHFAVFIGSTEGVEEHGEEHHDTGHGEVHSEESSGGKDDPDFTIGFDYERRFTKLIGLGVMLDFVVEGRREFLIGPIGFLHPFGGAKFFAAPLAERVRETEDWEFVVRVGAAWEFEIGKFAVAPYAGYDMSEEHDIWILGVAIGRGF